ncbi:M20/M25/M40 family metallo-hydrolase [Geochorda subterranea]|uniref:M20/M25/M40 family metallo-hydrolase n=1 Tax=Geochorda subterranea TaxID=3109564 RepID=A0ABZ1BQV3_9FIRM|nr:M20/M25/M40 family metallo-hydrolase [Limnochorda sp. LNt]WRP14497.1 M20/M25/M40 family metallo-hydrolase [Limnochorda sp. LNt]
MGKRTLTIWLVGALLLSIHDSSKGQEGALQREYLDAYRRLVDAPAVQAVLSFIESDHDRRVQDTLELVAIPAPPFNERERAEEMARRFAEIGLADVAIDAEGNVIGYLRGTRGTPKLVVSAHLDTVFPPGYDATPRIDEDGVIHAPGIGDDTAGLSALLSLARAFVSTGIRPVGDVLFVGTVGEEGRGDLRGVKYLFSSHADIDGFISIEGGGGSGRSPTESFRITYLALGSKRYEIYFRGPGGHSWGAFGLPSAIHAMGRAIARIAEMRVPQDPRTSFTVGVVSGGTSVNSIAAEAVMETDTRSVSPEQLERTVAEILAHVQVAVAEENARWGRWVIDVDPYLVGDRPSGTQSVESPMVQAAFAAATLLPHSEPALSDSPSSTDSNLPISLGVPAITVNGGGRSRGSHSPEESWDPANAWRAVQNVFLTVAGLAGIEGVSEPLLPDHPGYTYQFTGLPFVPKMYVLPDREYSFSWVQIVPSEVSR